MSQHRIEESAAIEEMEISTKHLKSAYSALINAFARITNNPDIKVNPIQAALDEVDVARQRFDQAKANIDKIVEEIRLGKRQ